MTEEFKKAVRAYVDAHNKIVRAVNRVNRNDIEEMEKLLKWAEPIAKQRDESRAKILEMIESEDATEEEHLWYKSMISKLL